MCRDSGSGILAIMADAALRLMLRPAHVLDDHRNVTPCGLARLALDAEASLKQRVVRRRQRLSPRPRHGAVAVRLARRTGDDQVDIAELRAVQRQDVLQHELRRVAMVAVHMLFDVEADHVIAFKQKPLSPAAESAE